MTAVPTKYWYTNKFYWYTNTFIGIPVNFIGIPILLLVYQKEECFYEMQNRPYSLYSFCAVKPHSFIYSLSSPCVLVGLSLSSLVHMSVCVYCSIGKKCFPFITYVCILFHAFSLPSCYIGTDTLLID